MISWHAQRAGCRGWAAGGAQAQAHARRAASGSSAAHWTARYAHQRRCCLPLPSAGVWAFDHELYEEEIRARATSA